MPEDKAAGWAHFCMIRFDDDRYTARRDVTFLRPRVFLFDAGGSVVSAARAETTRLRRRITIYGDVDLTRPIITVTGRGIVGLAAAYDVADLESEESLGSIHRPGFLSTDRDRWRFFDEGGRETARIRWASAVSPMTTALKGVFPRTWEVVLEGTGEVMARFRERWVAPGITCDVEFFPAGAGAPDRRFIIAGLMLLLFVR
jgi:hypothetical protein